MGPVYILGIETSCDETAAAVVGDGKTVASNVVASQISIHRQYGGVVPEVASRQHLEKITDVVEAALTGAGLSFADLGGIAVTAGPGPMPMPSRFRCWRCTIWKPTCAPIFCPITNSSPR